MTALNVTEVNISRDHTRKLLATGSSDAAIVYLYISCGNRIEDAEQNLKMSAGRVSCAVATLRQLGLWEEPKKVVIPLGGAAQLYGKRRFRRHGQGF